MSQRTRKRATKVSKRKAGKPATLQRRLAEALAREAASAEILASIRRSRESPQAVLDAIVRNLQRLFGTAFAAVFLARDGKIEIVAAAGKARFVRGMRAGGPMRLEDEELLAVRAMRRAQVLRLCPIIGNPDAPPKTERLARRSGFGSIIAAPMLRDGVAIGAVGTARTEAVPFDEAQVGLIQSFADQAVIAIENARLFNDTKEALEQQTATAEVLNAISGSVSDTAPVFEKILDSCQHLFATEELGIVVLKDDGLAHIAAWRGESRVPVMQTFPRPLAQTMTSRALAERRVIQVDDAAKLDPIPESLRAVVERVGHHSIAYAPMLAGDEAIGAIVVMSVPPRPLNDKQLTQLKTFADQAVIAIKNARQFHETREALERQTATAEILKVIAGSPSDTQPVFDAIARSAQQLFAANSAAIARCVDDMLHLAAHTAMSEAGAESLRKLFPAQISGQGAFGKAVLTGKPAWIADVETDPAYSEDFRKGARERGSRSLLAVPMLRDGAVIGVIGVTRREPGVFSDHQVELLKTFADQAVIAIENVRLFNETKEALEKQTATAEILGVISGTPTDTQPVFEAIVRNATRLCEAAYANVFRYDGERLHWVTSDGWPPDLLSVLRSSYPRKPDRARAAGRVILDKQAVHIEDTHSDPDYDNDLASRLRYRRILAVPLLRAGDVAGVITVGWAEPGPIPPPHEQLLKTFAAQAVIAIENVRLLTQTQEALERQTATAEILGAISSSLTDTQPVFDIIAERAVALCSGEVSVVSRFDGALIQLAAIHGITREGMDALRNVFPLRVDTETLTARAFRARSVIHVADVQADPSYQTKVAAISAGWRSGLAVPMLRGNEVIGVVFVGRSTAGLFTESQVELLKTFADQAVIAIENVRLLNETNEALEQQTAISEVLRVISGSPADVQPVLEAVAERAAKICDAVDAQIFLREDNEMRHVARFGPMPIGVELGHARPLSRGWAAGRAVLEARAIHIEDLLAVPREEYPVSHELR